MPDFDPHAIPGQELPATPNLVDDFQEVTDAPNELADFEQFVAGLDATFNYDDGTVRDVIANLGDDTVVNDEEEEDGEDEDVPDDTATNQDTDTPPPATVRVGDVDVPLSDLVAAYARGQAPPAPPQPVTPTPPVVDETPPEWVDQSDPTQMGFWKENVEQRKALAVLNQATAQQRQQDQRRQADADFRVALSQFKSMYPGLSDSEIDNMIRPAAAQMIPGLLATHANPVEALGKAMYIAGLENVVTRDKILGIATEAPGKKRQRKISSLSGTSGSAPRTTAAPRVTNDRQARDEFAQALAESFNGQSTN